MLGCRLSHFVRSYIYRTNLVGSAELINAALKANVSCFVFTSSIAVYGAGAGAGALSCTGSASGAPDAWCLGQGRTAVVTS